MVKSNAQGAAIPSSMNVRKRSGSLEPVDINKILRAVTRCAEGIAEVDPYRVAVKTIGSLADGATTEELDRKSIETAASLIPENANYSKLAAALLVEFIRKEASRNHVHTFSESIARASANGLVSAGLGTLVAENARKLDNAIKDEFNMHFEYYGLKSLYENHLLRQPIGGVIETPQHYLMRIAIRQAFADWGGQVNKTAPGAQRFVRMYREIATDPKVELDILPTAAETAKTGDVVMRIAPIAFRALKGGMGQAVAERTILRKNPDGTWENWGQVATRVALGNSSLYSSPTHTSRDEFEILRKHLAKANTLMSGRHLQHGDAEQASRNMEVFTNCSTSAASFLLFYLLLNGSGVGRCYDDDMMLINWDHAPNIRCVLDESHPDFIYGVSESTREARHKYGAPKEMVWFDIPADRGWEAWQAATATWDKRATGNKAAPGITHRNGQNVIWLQVPDSREGWAKALEAWETLAFEKIHTNTLLIIDFSPVRPKNMPIGGMQNRPASGPVPLMNAFLKAASMKGAGLAPWKQAIYTDHYFAECVLVGGARRAARMSTKHWADPSIFDFISVKTPLEFLVKTVDEAIALRKNRKYSPFLWSSNNSVAVDDEFWEWVLDELPEGCVAVGRQAHAIRVFHAVCSNAYGSGTGEPGFVNVHKLVQKDAGWEDLNRGDYVESEKYKLNEDTQMLMGKLAKRAKKKKYHMITNPCGEIALNLLGGFCVIVDGVPYHCDTLDEAEEMFRVVTRAMIRVNLMNSIYSKEVRRTNRIGVGMTGVHEFAWKFFGFGFLDLIDEEKSKDFWLTLARFNRAVRDEATRYSTELGVEVPHTMFTIKPAGTTSKLFGLTEGWHLPAMLYYLRWVQFRSDSPLVAEYRNNGYPTRELTSYPGTTIVGFPTAPTITELGMGDKLVTAAQATPEEQYQWLMLGEKYWINGTDEQGIPLDANDGNQISYTLKYDPKIVNYEHFRAMVKRYQSLVRCCSVMPQEDESSYEYLPEESISAEEFLRIQQGLEKSVWKKADVTEEIGREHVGCDNGACPVDFNSGQK